MTTHSLHAKAVVNGIIVEPRQQAIRVKPRHGPEIYIPYHDAGEIGRILQGFAENTRRVRI